MTDWLTVLQQRLAAGTPVVRLAVASVRGSAPREAGATLLFWNDAEGKTRIWGTIGGGHLEARAMGIAAHLLAGDADARRVERFSLGASLGQCCGGVVELYWERFDRLDQVAAMAAPGRDKDCRYCALDGSGREWLLSAAQAQEAGLPAASFSAGAGLLERNGVRYFVERLTTETISLHLYGAGHVGRALVAVLADLPFHVTWVDSREDVLTEAAAMNPRSGIAPIHAEAPEDAAAAAPAGTWHLVMSHSHDEDFRICETLLRKNDFGFLGVIGSRTKEARFRQRLLQKGCTPEALARMVCPIGIEGIRAKFPAAIAVSVAAQLLQMRELSAVQASPLHLTQGAVR